jgi:hypothetical protein
MPLSYVNPSHREPSAYASSGRVISEPGLARPSLNLTGGKRTRHTRRTRRRRGGFHPSVMGNFVQNASRLIPAVTLSGYRMIKNYKKSRKNRK